ncbi:Hpt domain-containing protein [Roseovarius marisflavi]|uniref:Hpt domain-containing protein n=1 Tax=Roseovarius marisflavi TaxID=1054996 RepID=A0A1M6XXT2_9RHOB|nr:Hpt domain-containing protein [Roseovarius marisflavi]SHL10790.1 Hpt domain-containing protein [Roseovarius marisflavi]
MIDWYRVQELRDEIGAEAFGEVVELFLEEVDDEIDKLRALSDRSNLESQLHFLKGSALNLGFAAFSDLCHKGEMASAAGQQDTVDTTEVLTCYDASKSAFLSGLDRVIAA